MPGEEKKVPGIKKMSPGMKNGVIDDVFRF
jgi:hypothetical protein